MGHGCLSDGYETDNLIRLSIQIKGKGHGFDTP